MFMFKVVYKKCKMYKDIEKVDCFANNVCTMMLLTAQYNKAFSKLKQNMNQATESYIFRT